MKRILYFTVLCALLLSFISQAQAFSISIGKPETFAKLVEKVSPSVVNIYTTKNVRHNNPFNGVDPYFDKAFNDYIKRYFQAGPEWKTQNSLGSGFFISEEGIVVTNYHVVAGAHDIFIALNDNKKVKAKLIGSDQKLDIALLKLDTPGDYEVIKLGESEKMRIGDFVVAVGNPFGLGQTVTAGIISAKGRVLGAGPYDDFIQTDASINPGNSGGPLFNLEGEVIGINTAIIASGQGMGFAIPIDMAKIVIDELLAKGKVTRGWLGISVKDINVEESAVLKWNKDYGVLVTDIVPKGPSAKSGIQLGDVIIGIEDKQIKNASSMPGIVAKYLPGAKVKMMVWRSEKEKEIVAVIGEMDDPNKAFIHPVASQTSLLERQDIIGIDVRNLESSDMANSVSGILITHVHQNSQAEKLEIKRGDVVVAINNTQISDVKEFKKKLKKIEKGDLVKLDIKRGDSKLFFAFQR
ncbi:MAG: Do family serine endopeptidase [bacterium]|nr:Do family serine endopeptidase [bacterium]MBU1918673.1 Do family serine endopeptidase [bacterium]